MAEISSTSTYEPTYDYSTIGSVGSEAAQSVNGEMINKIRAAEEEATLFPIIDDIDGLALEGEKIDEIKERLTEFRDLTNYFDIYNDENVFNQFLFDTAGSSAVFDVTDSNALVEGSTSVNVTQLAQRDVYQSTLIGDPENDTLTGSIKISLGGVDIFGAEDADGNVTGELDVTGMTYKTLAAEINAKDGLTASIEQVGDNSYRMVVKSTDTGTENVLAFTSSVDTGLGFEQTLAAQNLNATVDGISYDTSSNSIVTQGSLKITAVEIGSSTVTVSKDNSSVLVAFEELANKYNDFVDMIDEELYGEDATIEDKDLLRTILSDVKNLFFQSYGADDPIHDVANVDDDGDTILEHWNVTNNDKNIFVMGFSFDQYGKLSVDSDVVNEILNGENDNYDIDDLKNVFTGVYENKGLGVQLTEYIDSLTSYEGLIYNYEDRLVERGVDLEEDKEAEIERLDTKYGTMAEQFTAYSAIIAQMEASFGAVKMMIEQSTSSS